MSRVEHLARTPRHLALKVLLAVLLVALATTVAACGGGSSSSSGGSKTNGGSGSSGGGGESHPTINVAFNTSIATVDPSFSCETYGYTIIRGTYDQLVAPPPGGGDNGSDVKPMLAEKWAVSPDKKTYTFTIRKGVKFASGNPVTNKDVVYSFKRILDLNACAAFVFTGGLTDNNAVIKTSGPDDVVFKLKKADPIFLETMSSRAASVIDSKLLDEHGGPGKKGAKWLATHTAGSGPFVISSYHPDSEILLTARPDYWQGAPKPGKVDIKIVTDPSTLRVLTTSKQVDMAYGIEPKDISALKAQGLQILSFTSQFYTYVGLNNAKPPLNNVRVRQALALAFPTDDIIKAFGYGLAKKFAGVMPPAMPLYPNLPGLGYDPNKAKQLLQQAGVTHPTQTLLVQSGRSTHQQIATAMQAAYKKVGVNLKIKTLGASAFTDQVYNFKSQMYIIDDGPTVNDAGYLLAYLVTCGSQFNWVKYCNKTVDKELAQARFETDQAKRGALYKAADQTMIQESPYIAVMALAHTIVASPSLKGYTYYDDQTAHLFDITKG